MERTRASRHVRGACAWTVNTGEPKMQTTYSCTRRCSSQRLTTCSLVPQKSRCLERIRSFELASMPSIVDHILTLGADGLADKNICHAPCTFQVGYRKCATKKVVSCPGKALHQAIAATVLRNMYPQLSSTCPVTSINLAGPPWKLPSRRFTYTNQGTRFREIPSPIPQVHPH